MNRVRKVKMSKALKGDINQKFTATVEEWSEEALVNV